MRPERGSKQTVAQIPSGRVDEIYNAQDDELLTELRFQRAQLIAVVERRQLALGNKLLLDDGLLLVFRAFQHETYDRFVVLILIEAGIDHRVLLEQALLAFSSRCIEPFDSGFAIVRDGIWQPGGAAQNGLIQGCLCDGANRRRRGDESDNRKAANHGLGHHWSSEEVSAAPIP